MYSVWKKTLTIHQIFSLKYLKSQHPSRFPAMFGSVLCSYGTHALYYYKNYKIYLKSNTEFLDIKFALTM